MPKSKKIFLLHERHETWRFRISKKLLYETCDGCSEKVAWLAVPDAATVSRLTERELFSLVEEGKLHFIESASGLLLICTRSLNAIQGSKPVKNRQG